MDSLGMIILTIGGGGVAAFLLYVIVALSHRAPPTSPSQGAAPAPAVPPVAIPVAVPAPPRPNSRSPYECIPHLLTPAEADFFAVLQQAAPAGQQIFAQVSLPSLVQIKHWARGDKTHWYRIQAKRLDFVLVDAATFAPRLVVELDDASHDRADRRERDAFVDEVLASAGIPILRVRWQRRYDAHVLAGQIARKLGGIQQAPMAPVAAAPTETFWTPIAAPGATAPVAPALAAAPHEEPFWTPIALSAPAPALPYEAAAAAPAPFRHVCEQCQAEIREGAKFCAQCGVVFAIT